MHSNGNSAYICTFHTKKVCPKPSIISDWNKKENNIISYHISITLELIGRKKSSNFLYDLELKFRGANLQIEI